ncbi:MAG: MMPL family transporter, partial [Gammaproteobacteria bacterium]
LEDPNPLERSKLEALRAVIDRLGAMPCVQRVESLFSVPHVRSVDDFLQKDPYLAELPETQEASDELLREALKNPFVRHVLLSADGQAMAVAVILKQVRDGVDDEQLTARIDQVTRPLEAHYDRVYNIGFAYVRNEIAQRIVAEQVSLLPLAIGALLVALFVLLRQLVDVLTPILTAGLSILWTLGMMGLFGIPLNVVTSTVPSLLIVVGSTEDIHLLSEFRHGQRDGLGVSMAIERMARKMGRTVLLTFITTYAGFLSVGLSGIEVLWQFGLTASTGLAFNFLITISLIPALLRLSGHWQLDGRRQVFNRAGFNAAAVYWRWLHRHRHNIFVALAVASAAAAFGIPSIQVNHNAIDSLGTGSRVGADVARLNERFAGLESFSVVVDSGIQDTFLKVRYLNELVKIQDYLKETGEARSTTSFADYIALLNGAFQEFDSARMPLSDEVVDELMIFLNYDRVKGYVTEDYSRARILVRHDISSSAELKNLIERLQAFLDEQIDPGLRTRVTGDSVLTLSATRSMISGQLQSILLLLTFFVLIISFLFTDLRVGLLAALPNVFPVLVLFGVMGYAGIPLNIGTTMAAAIAIGIAVDDTMHFMLRYNQELKSSKSQARAMHMTIHEEALPVLSTSIALIAGFLVFSQSDFEPVAQFGLLSALVIGTALLADFVITPIAIAALRLVTLWDLLSSHLQQQVIPMSPLFRGMRAWQVRRFILSSAVLDFAPGDHVFRRDDDSNELYLVMQGVVEVSVPAEGVSAELVVDEFGAGEVFGDIAMLAEEPRRTNAVALTHTTLLVLTREAIASATLFHPFISSRLFYNLARDVSRRWVDFIARVKAREDIATKATEEDDNGAY